MLAYQPELQVTLVKTRRRWYRHGGQIDLTPFVMDGGGVHTTKSVREPAGGFTITLNDRPHPVLGDSLYGLVEPMDFVEIRMRRGPAAGGELPLVMRGLVSTVSRSERFEQEGPVRSITIAGQDFGKLLQALRIYYLPGSIVGEWWLDEFRFFSRYNMEAKAKPAGQFLAEVVDRVLNPYVQTVLESAGSVPGRTVFLPPGLLAESAGVRGIVSPLGVSSFEGGSVYDLLAQFLDVGAFNELYVDDRGSAIAVVLRPAPWRNLQGDVIEPGATFETVSVSDEDLMSLDVSRSDYGVANFFWVGNSRYELIDNGTLQLSAQTGQRADYTSFDYEYSLRSLYGVRKMEVESSLGSPTGLAGDGPPAPVMPEQQQQSARWLDERRRVLHLANRDNVLLESGTMVLKGNEAVRAGTYVELRRGRTTSSYYATAVSQSFVPAVGFTTTVQFERGTGFYDRVQRDGAPWFDERNETGVR